MASRCKSKSRVVMRCQLLDDYLSLLEVTGEIYGVGDLIGTDIEYI